MRYRNADSGSATPQSWHLYRYDCLCGKKYPRALMRLLVESPHRTHRQFAIVADFHRNRGSCAPMRFTYFLSCHRDIVTAVYHILLHSGMKDLIENDLRHNPQHNDATTDKQPPPIFQHADALFDISISGFEFLHLSTPFCI